MKRNDYLLYSKERIGNQDTGIVKEDSYCKDGASGWRRKEKFWIQETIYWQEKFDKKGREVF